MKSASFLLSFLNTSSRQFILQGWHCSLWLSFPHFLSLFLHRKNTITWAQEQTVGCFLVNAAFTLHTLVRDQSGSQIHPHQPASATHVMFVWVEAGWVKREGWGKETAPVKIVSISTSDGWCKELSLFSRTMVPARDSGVHYPEISYPLNPDSCTQRNERALMGKAVNAFAF